MRSRYQVLEPDGIYFLTATVVEWIPAFIWPAEREILIASLAHCRARKGLRLYAYVIMENHLHLVAAGPDITGTLRAFKGFTARRILEVAQASGRDWMVNQFAYYKLRHKTESTHQVWQEGLHPQLVQGEEMLRQKIAYIHNNPVRRGWVDLPEQWRYSSARNHLLGDHSVLEIDELEG